MINVAINGALGRMGKRIALIAHDHDQCEVSGALEYAEHENFGESYGSHIGRDLDLKVEDQIDNGTDVIIDFSSPAGTEAIVNQALQGKKGLVIGTTGLSEEQMSLLKEAARDIPLLYSTNMSLGVNLLRKLVVDAAKALADDFDIELVELHHRHKVDAPSGTALTLYEDICATLDRDDKEVGVYGREGHTGARTDREIGLHALRLGGVIGEHTVYFASEEERIELKHQAQNRDVFARGAVRAAIWLADKNPGFYTMMDVLFG